eukprot:6205400-Pleurochrysis_carterae.AAC.1
MQVRSIALFSGAKNPVIAFTKSAANADRVVSAVPLTIVECVAQVLLVSDPEADKAAACMDVSVGHSSDPSDLPGLAHFLEHMLFLGDWDPHGLFLPPRVSPSRVGLGIC